MCFTGIDEEYHEALLVVNFCKEIRSSPSVSTIFPISEFSYLIIRFLD